MNSILKVAFLGVYALASSLAIADQSARTASDLDLKVAYCAAASSKQLGTMLALQVALPANAPPDQRAGVQKTIQGLSSDLSSFRSYLQTKQSDLDSTALAKEKQLAEADVDVGMKVVHECGISSGGAPMLMSTCVAGSPEASRVRSCKGATFLH